MMAYLCQRVTCMVRPFVCSLQSRPCGGDIQCLRPGQLSNLLLVIMNALPYINRVMSW